MSAPRIRQLTSRLAAAWWQRWERLARAIRRHPTDDDAWLWQIQARILCFLLNRYGEDAALDRGRLGEVRSDPQVSVAPGFGTPPRSREAIRVILERIAAANRVWEPCASC